MDKFKKSQYSPIHKLYTFGDIACRSRVKRHSSAINASPSKAINRHLVGWLAHTFLLCHLDKCKQRLISLSYVTPIIFYVNQAANLVWLSRFVVCVKFEYNGEKNDRPN